MLINAEKKTELRCPLAVLMCIDWLRLKELTLQPARGSYAKRIMRVTRFELDITGSMSEVPDFQQIIKVGIGKHVQDAAGPLAFYCQTCSIIKALPERMLKNCEPSTEKRQGILHHSSVVVIIM